ncbi:MAG TPA: GlsB/YeaQ/YmgE family stress response membrane protein [Opitutaceae bacterium]|jgi:uncharacterized membrane protein YeaQ/YmgE (transglycosylase-associated protein family)|nr:GlsB/YeaQ/YmgE family stress response membrane protein [Opitutaceae bacterium]
MISLTELVTTLVVGLIAGWLGGVLTKGRGFGWIGNLVVGVIGAVLGSVLFGIIGLGATHLVGRILCALVGSLIFLSLLRFVRR